MSNSRSKNVFLNVFFGYIAQFGILFLSFIGRKIFVEFLAADYLGINGLFSNILSVLALAELGLGNVTQFFLYKPISEKNYEKVTSLFKYFKKLYMGIAAAVMAFGLMIIPFLSHIINSSLSQGELIIYYILFLLNSVVTYFSAPQIALLAANQDNRLHKIITLLTNFVLQFMHIAVLVIWKNYVVYVTATLLTTVLNVLVLNILTIKKFPFIKNKSEETKFDKKYIIDNVKSTFVYKVGAVIVNNTSNIFISILVSTSAVGLYSNYYMVVSGIQGFIAIITTSLISAIGNLSAQGNKERMHSVFNVILLFYNFIAMLGGIGFYFIFNDLITFWLGKEFLMSNSVVFAIALSFYVTNAISPIWMYREANGLFNKVKYLMLWVATANIGFSLIFGKIWGVFGVLFSASLARIVTQVWYEPRILFKNVFNKSQKYYWFLQIKYLSATVISFILCYLLFPKTGTGFLSLIIKVITVTVICSVVFIIFVFKSTEFSEIKNIFTSFIRQKNNRGN